MRPRVAIPLLMLGILSVGRAAAADTSALPSWLDLDVKAMVEARLALTSGTQSWEEGGLGKVRWGSSDGKAGVIARPEGAVVLQPHFGFDWSGFVHLQSTSQQRSAVVCQYGLRAGHAQQGGPRHLVSVRR